MRAVGGSIRYVSEAGPDRGGVPPDWRWVTLEAGDVPLEGGIYEVQHARGGAVRMSLAIAA